MRQVQVLVTCDPCQAWHGSEVSEGVQTVPVAGGQTLDLCPGHREDLAPFLGLVAEWGATPSANGATRKRSSGPVAPAEPARAPSKRGGKRARARRANAAQGAPTATPVAVAELSCPLCQKPVASPGAMSAHLRHVHDRNVGQLYGTTCPLCGEPGVRGMHLSRIHSVSGGMPAAFLVAEQQGDPHGVIADRALAAAGTGGSQ